MSQEKKDFFTNFSIDPHAVVRFPNREGYNGNIKPDMKPPLNAL